MLISHLARLNALKNYHKNIELNLGEIAKEKNRYKADVKGFFKELNGLFESID